MARLSLNVDQETFENAGRSFTPVPQGDYKVSIFAITPDEVKKGENQGKPRLKFQFRIADGEEAPDGTKQGNRRLFADVNAFEGTDKKTGKPTPPYDLVAIGKALGLSAEELADVDTDDWLGEELQVTVKHTRKQHQVNGTWVNIEPAEYRETVRGYRSLASVETSVAAAASVAGKAPAAAAGKGKAAGAKFKL
jgi:hypothetical protein